MFYWTSFMVEMAGISKSPTNLPKACIYFRRFLIEMITGFIAMAFEPSCNHLTPNILIWHGGRSWPG